LPDPSDPLSSIGDFYTRFPYPAVTADDPFEVRCGVIPFIHNILWPWRATARGLRVLDAGCGTGRNSVTAALNEPECEILAIDLSPTSLARARELADREGVGDRIEFLQMSLADLAGLGREFDYIICTGVLHHLEDPARGLADLAAVLAEDGGMYLMLYGTYGRAGAYMMQSLMRLLAPEDSIDDALALAERVVDSLPEGHPFEPVARLIRASGEHEVELADVVLNPRDRSFTVPEILRFVEDQRLDFIQFVDRGQYDPANYSEDEPLRSALAALPFEQRCAAAELLHGQMNTHAFFLANAGNRAARTRAEAVPIPDRYPIRSPRFGWDSATGISSGGQPAHRVTDSELPFAFPQELTLEPASYDLLRAFDGKRTVRQLARLPAVRRLASAHGSDDAEGALVAMLDLLAANQLIYWSPVPRR
jgi:SAM-dependent methyltransferase